ncbi:MAG: MerR family DNA-binding transcriptional regulator [Pseudohongiellaceae bacterium]
MNNIEKPPAAYSISELANEFDITTRAIRFYDEQGLLSSDRRSGVRIYSPAERIKLKLILRGKRLGFSLGESREIINMYDPSSENSKQLQFLLDRIREKRQQLERKRREVNSMLKDLNTAELNCITALSELAVPTRQKNRK